jgi:hypothetical protein
MGLFFGALPFCSAWACGKMHAGREYLSSTIQQHNITYHWSSSCILLNFFAPVEFITQMFADFTIIRFTQHSLKYKIIVTWLFIVVTNTNVL